MHLKLYLKQVYSNTLVVRVCLTSCISVESKLLLVELISFSYCPMRTVAYQATVDVTSISVDRGERP